jgi:hypothetical protein
MKTGIAAVMITLIALACYAAPPTAITNYYPGTVQTDSSFTNAGDTGLSVSNVYLCIPLSSITNAEYTANLVTNDVRPFISTLILTLDDAIDALASSNQFSTFTVSEDVRYSGATSRVVFRAVSEQQVITVLPGYPSE